MSDFQEGSAPRHGAEALDERMEAFEGSVESPFGIWPAGRIGEEPEKTSKGYSILDSCTGCGTCMSICPTNAISGGPGKVHSIDLDLCILCGSCARVCPSSCIEDSSGTIAQRLGKRFWSIPHFKEDECKGCGMCVSMCPSRVLVRSGGLSSVPTVTNPKLCASCRICSKVCIFDAVEFFPATNGSDILFDVHQVEPGEGD